MAKRIRSGVLLLLLLVVFLGMFAIFGPGIYNDSDQYINMHIHREPLYPLFLAALRVIFKDGWLTAMGILQNAFAAVSIWLFAEYMKKRFLLGLWEEMAIVLIHLMPHMITKYCSSLHLFITNSVMSEALCLPLFTLFLLECFKIFTEEKEKDFRKASVCALVLAFLISLVRTQMMITILMWLVVLCIRILFWPTGRWERRTWQSHRDGKWKATRILLTVAIVLFVFGLRMLTVKSYNLVFSGHFINNTYGTVNTLTNILYASDREDGERIKDDTAREFFYRMYDLTQEREANYKHAGNSLKEKTEHIEAWHDTIKYEMIEDVFYQVYDKTVTSDYIVQNLMADETAGKIIGGILPGCFFRWLGNYLLIARYGLIRSIAIVHPVTNWLALLIYLSSLGLTALAYRRNPKDPAIPVMLISLLSILANVGAVSMTIMCLSRYMIYGFAPFYTAYFLLLLGIWKEWRRKRERWY
ncbi:hypothetical protein D3Z45_01550 [Lachnospiraceae bacterium]|nr:hypothetical protein [Lachnospiraceae bacterium]